MARFWRKYHRWISVIITIPFLLTLCTGILLLFRGQSTWISPKYPPASGELKVSFEEILTVAQSVPELQVKAWKDIGRVDIRPESGAIVVRAKNSNFEAAIDGATGKVLGVGERMSSLLVSLHEGTYFGLGNMGRFSIALPMALGVFFLVVSGLVIFFQPILIKRRKKS